MTTVTDLAIYDGKLTEELSKVAPKINCLNGGYLIFVVLSNRTTRLIGTGSPYARLSNLEYQTSQFGAFIERVVIFRPIYGYLMHRKQLASVLKAIEQKPGELGSLDKVFEVSEAFLRKLYEVPPL